MRSLLQSIALCGFIAAPALADVIHVPGDYSTIQQAVDAAVDGDEVVVAPGTWAESVDLLGKAIILRSAEGPAVTVIASPDEDEAAVRCADGAGPGTAVEGFTLTGDGRGLWIEGSPTIDSCWIVDIFDTDDGVGVYVAGGQPRFRSCRIDNGCEDCDGAGVYVASGHPRFDACEISGNHIQSIGDGGRGSGIFVAAGDLTLVDCTLASNSTSFYEAASPLQGLAAGGAIYLATGGQVMAINCRFAGNGASSTGRDFCGSAEGGTIHGNGVFVNCVFEGNSVSADCVEYEDDCPASCTHGWGGALYGSGTLVNCTFIDNHSASETSDAWSGGWSARNSIVWDSRSGGSIAYSCVLGGAPGAGNIDADPLLAPGGAIQAGSPCIDAGSNDLVAADDFDLDGDGDTDEPLPLDHWGNPRFADDPGTPDTGVGEPPIVDMGAHEFQGVTLTGACCFFDGTCADELSAAACLAVAGTPQAPGTACATTSCPMLPVACCLGAEACEDLTLEDCEIAGGLALPLGSACAAVDCTEIGACCLPDDTCAHLRSHDCRNAGGVFQFAGADCAGTECPCDWQQLEGTSPDIDDLFGRSVAVSGAVAVIGAPGDQRVFRFRWNGAASGHPQAASAPDGQAGGFGSAVSVDGDVVIVGAPGNDEIAENAGAAYILRWSDGSWEEEQKITASDGAAGDLFGGAVSVSGETVVVGAARDDDGGVDAGSVYVFRWDGSGWTEMQKLTAPEGGADHRFGAALSATSAWIVAGSPNDDDAGPSIGSAEVFHWTGAAWEAAQTLRAQDVTQSFGASLSTDGELTVIGAPDDDQVANNAGATYVFRWDGATWAEEAKLTAPDASSNDDFGSAVAVHDGVIVAGAYGAETAYVFRGGPNWAAGPVLDRLDRLGSWEFGAAVALHGGLVLVGAPTTTWIGSASAYVIGCDACACDVDGSGAVDFADLLSVLGAWGDCPASCPQDLDGSGAVDHADLLIVLATWGPCPAWSGPGACCLPDGSCHVVDLEIDCTILGGIYAGPGVDCAEAACPSGACCLPNGTCVSTSIGGVCVAQGGVYQGDGTACADVTCLPPAACCLPGGVCLMLPPEHCALAGGAYQGDGITCATVSCP